MGAVRRWRRICRGMAIALILPWAGCVSPEQLDEAESELDARFEEQIVALKKGHSTRLSQFKDEMRGEVETFRAGDQEGLKERIAGLAEQVSSSRKATEDLRERLITAARENKKIHDLYEKHLADLAALEQEMRKRTANLSLSVGARAEEMNKRIAELQEDINRARKGLGAHSATVDDKLDRLQGRIVFLYASRKDWMTKVRQQLQEDLKLLREAERQLDSRQQALEGLQKAIADDVEKIDLELKAMSKPPETKPRPEPSERPAAPAEDAEPEAEEEPEPADE